MDKLEKKYFYYKKLFKSNSFSYDPPEELKELGDLLIYRRLKEKLDGLDVEQLAEAYIVKLEDVYNTLTKL